VHGLLTHMNSIHIANEDTIRNGFHNRSNADLPPGKCASEG
jgi:hypothetical protein